MNLPPAIRVAADDLHGVVTARQLLAAGLTRRQIHNLVGAGVLRRLHQGVYAVGHAAPSDHRRWAAAVLATEPVGALTGHSGARLLEISRRRKDRTHVLTSKIRRQRRGVQVTFSTDFSVDDTFVHDGIRVTKLGWLLLMMASNSSVGELTRTIREYAFRFDLDVAELRAFIRRMEGHVGIDAVRAACCDLLAGGGGTDSGFEDELGDALRTAFPNVTWISNAKLPRAGGGSYRVDYYCPEANLCVEGDPSQHEFIIDRLADLKRDDELLADRGAATIRISADAFRADRSTAFLPVAAHLARSGLELL